VLGEETSREGAKPVSAADHWILYKMRTSQEKISADLSKFRFAKAYDTLYHFVWDDLADWYIEASKAEPNKPLLAYLLEQVLVVTHPFAPFLTETIWQTLAWENDSILASRELSEVIGHDKHQAEDFEEIKAIVSESRYICRALHVSGITLYYTDVPFLRDNAAIIKRLASLHAVSEVRDGTGLFLTSTKHRCWLDIDAGTAKAYLRQLEDKRREQQALIEQLQKRLENKNYVKNAPKEVVNQTKDQLREAKELLTTLEAEEQRFST
jgi:valyl-tRNA synthetase